MSETWDRIRERALGRLWDSWRATERRHAEQPSANPLEVAPAALSALVPEVGDNVFGVSEATYPRWRPHRQASQTLDHVTVHAAFALETERQAGRSFEDAAFNVLDEIVRGVCLRGWEASFGPGYRTAITRVISTPGTDVHVYFRNTHIGTASFGAPLALGGSSAFSDWAEAAFNEIWAIAERHHESRQAPAAVELSPGPATPAPAGPKRVLRMPAVPAVALLPAPSGERNALELTTAEFFARLPCGLSGEGFDRITTRALMLLNVARGESPLTEVFESHATCWRCGNASYRYRWIRSLWDEMPPVGFFGGAVTDVWYCVCGYEVGAPPL